MLEMNKPKYPTLKLKNLKAYSYSGVCGIVCYSGLKSTCSVCFVNIVLVFYWVKFLSDNSGLILVNAWILFVNTMKDQEGLLATDKKKLFIILW